MATSDGPYRTNSRPRPELHVDTRGLVIQVPGTEHAPMTGPDEECWCLSRLEPPGVRFTGGRGRVARLFSH